MTCVLYQNKINSNELIDKFDELCNDINIIKIKILNEINSS